MPNILSKENKSRLNISTAAGIFTLLLMILGLSACGNKGDLYLPDEPEVQQVENSGAVETSKDEKTDI